MELYTFRMIIKTIVILSFFHVLHSYPNVKLPKLDVSTPEEVNSLEQEEPLGRSIDPETNNNIEATIQEVEDIIKSNPELPRLTRGEILDLLENITNNEKTLGKNRNPKAVMVVMPYTPTNDKNMEDLFTKAPVTQIIGAEPFKPKEENSKNVDDNSDNDLAKKPLVSEEKKKYSASFSEVKVTTLRNPVRRKRPEATTQIPTTKRPTRRTTTKHPNHRYPEEYVPSQGLRIIEPPNLNLPQYKNDLTDLELQENIRQDVISSVTTTTTTTSTTPQAIIEEINFPPSLKTLVKDLHLDEALNPNPSVNEENRMKSILASIQPFDKSTSTTSAPDGAAVVDSLSPEMRDLLMSFGLLPKETNPSTEDTGKFYPEKAETRAESYIGFKPLPDDGPKRDDMDKLLASFGLGRSSRRQKSLRRSDRETLNFDMVPENLKGVISDLGIEDVTREPKKIEKQHVFNPDNQYATEEELKKLDSLIGMIKELEKTNGTVTEDSLKKLDLDTLKDLLVSLNGNETLVTLDEKENSPDPTSFNVGVNKNEVKRQEATTVKSTTESETPSIKLLEESFGGNTETTTTPLPETTTRKTGFYYLVDWNTFLDIDDTKGKRVNLRFQPTIGDPKRFLSVTVP